MIEVIIQESDEQERLDRLLTRELGESRAQIQRWIEMGRVTVDGKAVIPREKCSKGTVVTIHPPEPEPDHVEPEAMNLDILYEDKDLIAINKAVGLVVHPGAGSRTGTLVAGLLHHCRGELSGIGGVERPGIVHRLDKDTSGVMIAAKNDYAHQRLAEAFQQRQVQKVYRAFTHRGPKPSEGHWEFPLGRHPVHRKKQAVRKDGGRQAHTEYRLVEKWEDYSLVQCRLHTGRTHQIRVHAAHAGCPLVGDVLYGGKTNGVAGAKRQMLHAYRLGISHPRTGESLDFQAPLPEDFLRFHSWLNQSQ